MNNDLKVILGHLGFRHLTQQSPAAWARNELDTDAPPHLLSESEAVAIAESWARYQLNQCAAANEVFAAFANRAKGWEEIDQSFHDKTPLPEFARELQAKHRDSPLSSAWAKDFSNLLSRYGNKEHTVFGAVLSDLMLAAHDKNASCCPNSDSGNGHEQRDASAVDY